jgi:hypothetical protein
MSKDKGAGLGQTITYAITATVDGLQKAFTQAASMTAKFGRGIQGAISGIASPFNAIAGKLHGILGPLAAATTAWASLSSVIQAFERSESLGKVANNLGIAVDKLSQLQYVAEQSQSSAGAMDTALRKMATFLGEVTDAGSEASMSLAKLGLSAKDLEGLTTDEAFLKVADALQKTTNVSERLTLQQKIFGKSSQEVAGVLTQGSDAIREMMKEGDGLNRTLKNIEYGQIIAAKDSIEHLQAAFRSLADKLTLSLAPAIDFIAKEIDAAIGDVGRFGGAFGLLTDGIIYSIGLVKMAWQGVQLMWEGAKVVIGDLSLAFYRVARDIVQGSLLIADISMKTWDVIAASFVVTGNLIKVGWEEIAAAGIKAFAFLQEKIGESMRAIGNSMIGSGIAQMREIGEKLLTTGTNLIGSAGRMADNTSKSLEKAKDSLDKSVVALEGAREAFKNPADTSTPYFDTMIANAEVFRDKAIEAFKQVSEAIASQEGGNAVSATWAAFARSVEEFQKRATEAAQKGSTERAVIADAEAAHTNEVYTNFWSNHAKATQDFNDEMLILSSKNDAIIAARQQEFNNQQTLREERAIDQQVMLWRSGWEGKAQILSGVLGDLASLMQSKSKSMFEVGKIAAIAQTVLDTIVSASSSFRFGAAIGGPVVGAAFAAAATAAGFVRLQQIKSTTFGSSSGGAGGGGGGRNPGAQGGGEQAAPQINRQINVSLNGDRFSQTQVRALIGQINEATDDNTTLKSQVA